MEARVGGHRIVVQTDFEDQRRGTRVVKLRPVVGADQDRTGRLRPRAIAALVAENLHGRLRRERAIATLLELDDRHRSGHQVHCRDLDSESAIRHRLAADGQ
jgi:hypothetical protein